MAHGKSLELSAIKRPEPVVLVPGKITNRAWRRANRFVPPSDDARTPRKSRG